MLLSLYFSEKDVWGAFWETQVLSLGQEDPVEKEMATHSSIYFLKNPMDREAWWATVHEGHK